MLFVSLGTTGELFQPSLDLPALQYVAAMDNDSPAEQGGLQVGDFLIEVRFLQLNTLSYIRMKDLSSNAHLMLNVFWTTNSPSSKHVQRTLNQVKHF